MYTPRWIARCGLIGGRRYNPARVRHPGTKKRHPLLEHIRNASTLRYIDANCTAPMWRNDFGLELRIEHGGELIESRSSRYGIEPLADRGSDQSQCDRAWMIRPTERDALVG